MSHPDHEIPSAPLADQPDRARLFLDTILADAPDLWSDKDQAAMLLHQLQNHPMASMEQKLAEYKRIKSRMKRAVTCHPLNIPPELARSIYYVVIARAHIELGQSISELSVQDIRTGLKWITNRPWVKKAPQVVSMLEKTLHDFP